MRHPILLPALALAAVLAACGDREQLTAPGLRVPPPNASISDGAHNVGNRNFYFLPPLVRSPVNDPGFADNEFNGGLRARVVICVLGAPSTTDGSRQCVADFRTFTPDQITVSTLDKLYQVNWDTKSPAIDINSYYRIQIFVGSTRLGYADVDPVSNGSQLKNVDTDEYIGLVDGRTLPIKFTIHRQALCQSTDCAEMYVGDGGGVVKTNTGFAAARFPDGWLPDAFRDQQVLVTIDRVPFTSSSQCHPLTAGLSQFEGCYTFRTDPYVGTFKLPVTAQVCTTVEAETPLYHSLQLFSSGPDEPVHALADAAAPDIFCEGFGPTPVRIGDASGGGPLGFAMKGLKAIGRGFDALFTVKSAYAIHLGLGGEATAFSNIGWGSLNDLVVGSRELSGTVGSTHTVTARVVKHHSDIPLPPDGEGDPTDAPIPVAGVNVVFSSGETVLATVPTDANGYASYDWTLGEQPGTETLTISSPDANGDATVTATVLGGVDLVIQGLAITPNAQTPNRSVNARFTIQNAGAEQAQPFSIIGFLADAPDATLATPGIQVISGIGQTTPIDAGASAAYNVDVGMPSVAEYGRKYLIFAADWGQVVPESNEANNSASAAVDLLDGDPDLAITTAVRLTPNQVCAGRSVGVSSFTVQNQGFGTSGAYGVRFVLTNGEVTLTAQELATQSSINVGTSVTYGSVNVTIPAIAPAGEYAFGPVVYTDGLGKPETSTTNNRAIDKLFVSGAGTATIVGPATGGLSPWTIGEARQLSVFDCAGLVQRGWSSTNTEVATVNGEGVVTGISTGTADIVLTGVDAAGNAVSARVTISVIPPIG